MFIRCLLVVTATLLVLGSRRSVAFASPLSRLNVLVIPVDFAEEPGFYDPVDTQQNWVDPLVEYYDTMSDGQFTLDVTLLTFVARPSDPRWRYHRGPPPPPGQETVGLWKDPASSNPVQDALDSGEVILLSDGLAPFGGAADDVFDFILFAQTIPAGSSCTYASQFGGRTFGPSREVVQDTEHGYYVGYDMLDASSNCLITERADWGGSAHELGHAISGNFDHPSGYENFFDTMDDGWSYAGALGGATRMDSSAEYGGESEWFQGWIGPSNVVVYDPPVSATETLEPISASASPGLTPNVIRVGTSLGYYYTVECRRKVGDDVDIPNEGIVILKVTPGAPTGAQERVMQGGFASNWDYAFAPGETFVDGDADLKIDINPWVGTGCSASISYGPNSEDGAPDVGIIPWISPPLQTWETVDLWVDSSCNEYEEDFPTDSETLRYGRRSDPEMSVIGNGDDPCFDHENRLYARVRNFGTIAATNVDVTFQRSNPLGVGLQPDTGWQDVGTAPTIPLIPPGGFVDVYVPWVPSTPETLGVDTPNRFAYHSCFRVTMNNVVGEVVFANQDGMREQENVDYFEIMRDSLTLTYGPAEQNIFLSNLGNNVDKVFYLGIESSLPDTWSLTVGSGEQRIVVPAGAVASIPIRIEVPFGTNLGLDHRVRVVAYEEVPGIRDDHMSFVSALVIEARTVPDARVGLQTQAYVTGNGKATVVSACLGAAVASQKRVTLDYVDAFGTITPQNVQTDANGCFSSSLLTFIDHPTAVRAIWDGGTSFSRAISEDVNPSSGDCCDPTAGLAGCGYPSIEECVCLADSYCCNNQWDSICVDEVTSLGCGACHDACTTGAARTREDDIEACVCARDTYCCATSWDSVCVGEVDSLGCGSCSSSSMMSGSMSTGSSVAETSTGRVVMGTETGAVIERGGALR